MNAQQRDLLIRLGKRLIDQEAARIIVPPLDRRPGFWFGGGNMVEDGDGTLYLVGRYRNAGDSTTGLAQGSRGLELAIFASSDGGQSFRKRLSFSKQDLRCGDQQVISIEGSALNLTDSGVELYVSTEKADVEYPPGFESFRKPGTGVWTIDRIVAPDTDSLKGGAVRELVRGRDPQHLHCKDPVIHRGDDGGTILFFCTHPFSWSSSNSSYCVRAAGAAHFGEPSFGFFPRGNSWDVAVTRITDVLTLGERLSDGDATVHLVFYDGAENLRALPENAHAVRRPRGYSCEEIGGLAFYPGNRVDATERLSLHLPLFTSPHGTGSSRYAHALPTERGLFVTWQQAQPDGSQPLVLNVVPWQQVEEILADWR